MRGHEPVDPATPEPGDGRAGARRDGPSAAARRLRPRPVPRPRGRAVVGGLLVTVAAVVVFSAYAGAGERRTAPVVVAGRDIVPGRVLTDDDLEVRTSDLPGEVVGTTFESVDDLVGRVALGPVDAGELVQAGSVRAGGPDERPEFSFPVDRERALAGDVRAGEQVDLLATFGTGTDAETVVLATDAQVRRVEEARAGTLGSSGRLVLTVGLASGAEVLDVAHASQVATITVVRAGAGGGSTGDRTSSDAIEGRP